MRTLAYDDCQRRDETVQDVGAHPFGITVRDSEFMKESYARGYLIKLWIVKVHQRGISWGAYSWTRQAQAVGLRVGLRVFGDVSVGHPLGDDSEMLGALGHGDPHQRQDVRMR